MSDDWRPIETAPKDGTEIIISCWGASTKGELFPYWLEESFWKQPVTVDGKRYSDGWHLTAERARAHHGPFPATHWMRLPLPSPPKDAG